MYVNHLWEAGTTNIQAYDKHMRGNECFFRGNEKDNKQAQQFYKEAINIDRSYAFPHAMLGYTHMIDLLYGWSKSPIESFEQAEKCAENALNLNDSLDLAHLIVVYLTLAACYTSLNRSEDAHKAVDEILRINPNFSLDYYAAMLPYKRQETTDKYVEALRKAGLPE